MQRLIIGDIHGCFDELQDLLALAGLVRGDEIIALGDIVDRGPQSPQVLQFFDGSTGAVSLMGNHERKHVHSHGGRIRPALSQQITRRQIGETGYDGACRTMDAFPRWLELPDAILVHGFYERGIPLAEQRETVVVGTLSGEHRLQRQDRRPWYERYDGDKPLIVGHHDYLRNGKPLIWNDRVYAVDTGCCHGGRLSGLLLPSFRILSVPSRCDYWTELQAQYADLRYATTAPDQLTWEAAENVAARCDVADGMPPERLEHARNARALLHDAERAVREFYALLSRRHEEVMRQIAADVDPAILSAQKLGRRYTAQIGNTPLAKYLHRLRQGKLDRESLQGSFRGPSELVEFVRRHCPVSPEEGCNL